MTRGEAIAQLNKRFPYDYDKHENTIDFYIEMGMLKVEKEKTIEEKLYEMLKNETISVSSLLNELDHYGLEIVEKKK